MIYGDTKYVHSAIGHVGILDVIVDICETEKQYGTIFLMALMSQHHRAIVQPQLNRIRKRIVLKLDDYEWRDKSKLGRWSSRAENLCALGYHPTKGT